jgi:hypothetical protein
VVKASSKRSSRDSVLGITLSSPSTAVQDPNSSVATLGGGSAGGSVKLSAAQTELQACEAHLALKEQELERVRVRAVIGGLQRRCKALVECGWMWGEKGKEALRALETAPHDANEEEKASNGIGEWVFFLLVIYVVGYLPSETSPGPPHTYHLLAFALALALVRYRIPLWTDDVS